MTPGETGGADRESTRAALLSAGGTDAWVALVMERFPFPDGASFRMAQELAWAALDDGQWHTALAALAPAEAPPGDAPTQQAADVALRLYEAQFGIPFVTAAWCVTADELLMRVRIRLGNDEDAERGVARDEARRLIRQRVERGTIHDGTGVAG